MIWFWLLLASVFIVGFAAGAALERAGGITVGAPFSYDDIERVRAKVAMTYPGEFVELTPGEMNALRYMIVPAIEMEKHDASRTS